MAVTAEVTAVTARTDGAGLLERGRGVDKKRQHVKITVRVPPQDHKLMEQAAKRMAKSVSSFLRDAGVERANKIPDIRLVRETIRMLELQQNPALLPALGPASVMALWREADYSDIALVAVDDQSRVIYVNYIAMEMAGAGWGELVGQVTRLQPEMSPGVRALKGELVQRMPVD